jgi:hypothetical protein
MTTSGGAGIATWIVGGVGRAGTAVGGAGSGAAIAAIGADTAPP